MQEVAAAGPPPFAEKLLLELVELRRRRRCGNIPAHSVGPPRPRLVVDELCADVGHMVSDVVGSSDGCLCHVLAKPEEGMSDVSWEMLNACTEYIISTLCGMGHRNLLVNWRKGYGTMKRLKGLGRLVRVPVVLLAMPMLILCSLMSR